MSRTVLLTGGCGDLGTVLSTQLVERGFDPIRLDIQPPHDGVDKYVEQSILERSGLAEHLQTADVVVHIAAWHGVHETRGWKNEEEFWDLNATGTFNVFQACVDAGVDKVVYISSTSVEEHASFYGFTKRVGESIAQEYAKKHNLNVIILRPRAFIPHWNRDVYANFVEWARWFWKGAVHINDVAQSVWLSIDLLLREHITEVLTLTIDGAHDFSDEDLASWDAQGTGSSFREYYGEYLHEVEKYRLDISLKPSIKDISAAQEYLGYEPTYGLGILLEELRKYGKAGPPK